MDEVIQKLVNHYDEFSKKLGKFDARISGLDALFVWQFVRYNPLYRIEYDLCRESLFDELLCGPTQLTFGIPEPVNYNDLELPVGFYFSQTLVNTFDITLFLNNEAYQRQTQKNLSKFAKAKRTIFGVDCSDPVVGFAVNLNDDPDSIAKMIKHELIEQRGKRKILGLPIGDDAEKEDESNDEEFKKFRGSSTRNVLIDWLITHHYKEEAKLSWSQITQKHKQFTGKEPDPTRMKAHIRQFKELAQHSPYSFFLQTN